MRAAFLRKDARYDYMVFIDAGLPVDKNDNPYTTLDTVWNRAAMFLWVMDGYANLFIYDQESIGNRTGIVQVNHSSMTAGKEVICAGMIIVDPGRVLDITNTSGHYKPSKAALAQALRPARRGAGPEPRHHPGHAPGAHQHDPGLVADVRPGPVRRHRRRQPVPPRSSRLQALSRRAGTGRDNRARTQQSRSR